MKKCLAILFALALVVLSRGAAMAQESGLEGVNQPAVSSDTGSSLEQKPFAGPAGEDLLQGGGMSEMISSFVEETKNLPDGGKLAGPTLVFGQAYPQIGTFDNWTMWLGWNGSFSDTYANDSETYAWVVYFAPEGVYVALQSAKSVYSGVNVFGSLGYFLGALASPDGTIVTKDYINSLCGITITRSWAATAPVGALSGLGMSLDTGLTFFRTCDALKLKRAVQYNTANTVTFDLIAFPLPLSVSLDTSSSFDAGFYPIIDWSNMTASGDTPINTVLKRLQLLASTTGSSYVQVMSRQFAKMLLPVFTNLKTSGKVTMTNTSLPTTSQFFGQFLQNNSVTVPATSPKPSADHFITSVEKWLASGDTSELSSSIKQSSNVLADPPETFKRLEAGTGIGFEIAYKHAANYYNYAWTYCDTVKNITCSVGQTCAIQVTAGEISSLVPGSTAGQFEGIDVLFNNPSEQLLASGYNSTAVAVKNGKAVFRFVQNSSTPVLIAPEVGYSALTNNNKLKLCRRLVQVPSGLPEIAITAPDPDATWAGDTGRFVVKRTGSVDSDLIVNYDVGGSAVAGTDYKKLRASLKIPAGSASASLKLYPITATVSKPVKTVIVRLSNDVNYTVGNKSEATVSIKNP